MKIVTTECVDVEQFRRQLADIAIGRKIAGAWLRTDCDISHETNVAAIQQAILRKTIAAVRRKGKYLWLEFAEGRPSPLFMFNMDGKMIFYRAPTARPPSCALEITLDDGACVSFASSRKLGKVHLVHDPDKDSLLKDLGADPIDSFPELPAFRKQLGARCAVVKAVMLDDGFIAHYANWMADEACFQARIAPQVPAKDLSDDQVARLHRAMGDVLRTALEVKASKDYPRGWLFHVRHLRDASDVRLEGQRVLYEVVNGRVTVLVPALQYGYDNRKGAPPPLPAPSRPLPHPLRLVLFRAPAAGIIRAPPSSPAPVPRTAPYPGQPPYPAPGASFAVGAVPLVGRGPLAGAVPAGPPAGPSAIRPGPGPGPFPTYGHAPPAGFAPGAAPPTYAPAPPQGPPPPGGGGLPPASAPGSSSMVQPGADASQPGQPPPALQPPYQASAAASAAAAAAALAMQEGGAAAAHDVLHGRVMVKREREQRPAAAGRELLAGGGGEGAGRGRVRGRGGGGPRGGGDGAGGDSELDSGGEGEDAMALDARPAPPSPRPSLPVPASGAAAGPPAPMMTLMPLDALATVAEAARAAAHAPRDDPSPRSPPRRLQHRRRRRPPAPHVLHEPGEPAPAASLRPPPAPQARRLLASNGGAQRHLIEHMRRRAEEEVAARGGSEDEEDEWAGPDDEEGSGGEAPARPAPQARPAPARRRDRSGRGPRGGPGSPAPSASRRAARCRGSPARAR
eukprot:tig00001250_g7791.t1